MLFASSDMPNFCLDIDTLRFTGHGSRSCLRVHETGSSSLQHRPRLPCSMRRSMRSLSMSVTFSVDTSVTCRPAPQATDRATWCFRQVMALSSRAILSRLRPTRSSRMRQPDELSCQVRTIECAGEEETQRRHDAFHGLHGNAALLLRGLEQAQVIDRGRIRRPARKVLRSVQHSGGCCAVSMN